MTAQINWQGFHHIALVTLDLEATIHFYRDILGMQAGEILARRERHCFIQPGGTTWGLHFFETVDADIPTNPALLTSRFEFIDGALQHIAFAVPDEATALTIQQNLEQAGVKMTTINQIENLRNFLFFDNNGILLEVAWKIDG